MYPASVLQIRFASSIHSHPSDGRVEVNYNGHGWGTVCDRNWTLSDADVACQMRGFNSASLATSNALLFGAGNGTIWFADVECLGNESSLLECSHSNYGAHNCHHDHDVGVKCSCIA